MSIAPRPKRGHHPECTTDRMLAAWVCSQCIRLFRRDREAVRRTSNQGKEMSGKPAYTRHHRHCIYTMQDPATCEECARWRVREATAARQRRLARNGGRAFKKVTTEQAPREFNMRIPEVLRDRLREVAEQNHMSMNALMVRALSDKYLDPRIKECSDPNCGCMEPTFTDPYNALVFLAGRMEFAGVSDVVARTYARDIRAMMKDVYRITIDKLSTEGCTVSVGNALNLPELPEGAKVYVYSKGELREQT